MLTLAPQEAKLAPCDQVTAPWDTVKVMSSQSTSPERTLNRVVRAGVTVANAARRRRPRRRSRRPSPPPPPPKHSQPSTLQPPSLSFPDQILLSTHSSTLHPDPQTRRRHDLRQTLLSFPEHDPSTVTALLNHYHGDRDRVIEKLSQARTTHIPPKSKPVTASPQSKPPIQPIALLPDDRRSPSLVPSPRSPPPLTLATQPRHHRRPSRRFSREAAAPLWAAAVRTTASSDISSASSSVYTHPETPRLAGAKRPRRSPIASGTPQASAAPLPELHTTSSTAAAAPVLEGASTDGTTIAMGTMGGSQDPGTLLLPTPAPATASEPENVQLLVRRVSDLEGALSRFVEKSESGRKEVGRRLQSAELEMGALERRHETLEHELEENRKRVSKTEQYLDTMRRDVRYAIGGRESRFFVIARQGMNGLVFYLLAYLVPVLFFLARAMRGAVATIRRRVRASY